MEVKLIKAEDFQKLMTSTGISSMKTPVVAHNILLILIVGMQDVSSQSLTLDPPVPPPPGSICDSGFAAGLEKFVIRGKADIGSAPVTTEWDNLKINLEYADGTYSMCILENGCPPPAPNKCYCTGQTGQIYDLVFNLSAAVSFTNRTVRIKWTSTALVPATSNDQTLLEMYAPVKDSIEVDGIIRDLPVDGPCSSNCYFEVGGSSDVNVKFCVGETASNYVLTLGGSVTASSNSNNQCISGTIAQSDIPGNFTINYTKTTGCIRQREYTIIVTTRSPPPPPPCWCKLDGDLPCGCPCIILIIIFLLGGAGCALGLMAACCPQMICCCYKKDVSEVCGCCKKYRRHCCENLTWCCSCTCYTKPHKKGTKKTETQPVNKTPADREPKSKNGDVQLMSMKTSPQGAEDKSISVENENKSKSKRRNSNSRPKGNQVGEAEDNSDDDADGINQSGKKDTLPTVFRPRPQPERKT